MLLNDPHTVGVAQGHQWQGQTGQAGAGGDKRAAQSQVLV